MKEILKEEIHRLVGVVPQQVGGISFPKASESLLFVNAFGTLGDAAVGFRDLGLFDKLWGSLHTESDQIEGIGEAHGYSRENGETAVIEEGNLFHGKKMCGSEVDRITFIIIYFPSPF